MVNCAFTCMGAQCACADSTGKFTSSVYWIFVPYPIGRNRNPIMHAQRERAQRPHQFLLTAAPWKSRVDSGGEGRWVV